ncbi:MAG: DUF3782 domain-containing protein [Prochloron sp. SP5CPC1]|nr:DUF3782 domain-containing protein [Candidatus Paraprochloron terpiosi SP5CPC1]
MSESFTINDIYNLFQASQAEADRRFAEADRRLAKLDRIVAELAEDSKRRRAEAERRTAEADRRAAERAAEADRRAAERAAESDRIVAELAEDSKRRKAEAERRAAEADRIAAERAAEADRRAAEAEKRLAKAEAIAANTNKAVSALTSRWEQFLENFVEPAAVNLFQARGIPVTETHRRVKTKRAGLAMEIDLLAVDDDVAVAVEVKSHLSKADVDYFLEKLARFKQAFPRYTDIKLNGAVAAIDIDEGIDRYVYRRGLFLIQQSGEVVEIANDENFLPGEW